MKEYWVNVYKYPKLKHYCYGHLCPSLSLAIWYSSPENNINRKTVYRIHVRIK